MTKEVAMRVKITLLVVAALVTAVPALAQSPGAVEVGLFFRDWLWGHETQIEDWVGFGGRAGYFFAPNVELEGSAAFSHTSVRFGRKVDVVPLSARLIWNYPATAKVSLLLGAGYTHVSYGGDVSGSGNGPSALAGLRLSPNERFSIRLEGTVDGLRRPFNAQLGGPGGEVPDYGIQAGVSWLFGGRPKDSDHDGVPDYLDKCPGTPRGVKVDERGCRIEADGDHDGVPDNLDKCPDTPRGVKVDASGCPIDSDHDGVPDYRDKCPDTPRGTKVDERGCPIVEDSDHDGVPDNLDRCPDTPRGVKVDANGCPIAKKVFEEGKKSLILEGVRFETNKATLTPESREILDKVAESLQAYPDVKVEVQGHTDSRGSKALNTKLSHARAEAVRDYLISKGVAAAQLKAKGYGPSKPVADNKTEAGRAKNRRVQLERID